MLTILMMTGQTMTNDNSNSDLNDGQRREPAVFAPGQPAYELQAEWLRQAIGKMKAGDEASWRKWERQYYDFLKMLPDPLILKEMRDYGYFTSIPESEDTVGTARQAPLMW